MQFTAENIPKCEKCKERMSITKMENGLWVCGECMHTYLEKLKEKHRQVFLEA